MLFSIFYFSLSWWLYCKSLSYARTIFTSNFRRKMIGKINFLLVNFFILNLISFNCPPPQNKTKRCPRIMKFCILAYKILWNKSDLQYHARCSGDNAKLKPGTVWKAFEGYHTFDIYTFTLVKSLSYEKCMNSIY